MFHINQTVIHPPDKMVAYLLNERQSPMELTININLTSEQAMRLRRILTPIAMGYLQLGDFRLNETDARTAEDFSNRLLNALMEVQG